MSLGEKLSAHKAGQEKVVLRVIGQWSNVHQDGPAVETVKHQASLRLRRGQVGRAIRRLEKQKLVEVTKPSPDTPYGTIVGKRVRLTSF